ncbi:MAG TPA: hypothetical protein VFD03_00300 [Clostridia bacterium]|nr:hypothetical protein [Clostridia bacterium]
MTYLFEEHNSNAMIVPFCKKACPVGAIGEGIVNQRLCRPHSIVDVGRQWGIYACAECRKKCPMQLGSL